jgi:4-amino-4-deoxy-L-arabinose transferase-like glycosyltransferase
MNKLESMRLRYYFALFIIFLVTILVNITYSFRLGRLSAPPLYDDVVYFASAIKILTFSEGNGFFSVIKAFLLDPPHAPLSTATGLLGFWLIGPNPVAAYIASTWVLAIYILVVSIISKPLDNSFTRFLFVLIFMFIPASHALINEFRPDMAAGLLFGLTIYAICNVNLNTISRRRSIGIGLLVAATMIAKPSALVITFPIVGAVFIGAILNHSSLLSVGLKPIIARLLPGLCSFALVIIPFFIFWGANTFRYIYQVLVTNADIWRTPGDWVFHWTYHSFGLGGKQALGPFLIAGLVIILFDFIAVFNKRNTSESRGILLFYLILVLIYGGMSSSNEKTVFQGSFFYFPFVIVLADALKRLILKYRCKWAGKDNRGTIIFLASIVTVLFLFVPLATSYTITSANQKASIHAYNETVSQVSTRINEMMLTQGCIRNSYKIMDTSPDPFPSIGVLFSVASQGLRLENGNTYFAKSYKELFALLADTDFVLSPDPNMPGVGHHLPGLKYLAQLNDELMINPSFEHHKIDTIYGYPLWLFIRSCKQH